MLQKAVCCQLDWLVSYGDGELRLDARVALDGNHVVTVLAEPGRVAACYLQETVPRKTLKIVLVDVLSHQCLNRDDLVESVGRNLDVSALDAR